MSDHPANAEELPQRRSMLKKAKDVFGRRATSGEKTWKVAPGGPFQESVWFYAGGKELPWEMLEGYLESKWPGFKFAGEFRNDSWSFEVPEHLTEVSNKISTTAEDNNSSVYTSSKRSTQAVRSLKNLIHEARYIDLSFTYQVPESRIHTSTEFQVNNSWRNSESRESIITESSRRRAKHPVPQNAHHPPDARLETNDDRYDSEDGSYAPTKNRSSLKLSRASTISDIAIPENVTGRPSLTMSLTSDSIPILDKYLELSQIWNKRGVVGTRLFNSPPIDSYLQGYISDRHFIFVADNASSMRSHWMSVKRVLMTLAMKIGTLDKDGLDLWYTNGASNQNKFGVTCWDIYRTFDKSLDRAEHHISHLHQTDMCKVLNKIFDTYISKGRFGRTTLIILTDGVWADSVVEDDVEYATAQFVSDLSRRLQRRELRWFSIQFVSFGENEDGLKRLTALDDDMTARYKMLVISLHVLWPLFSLPRYHRTNETMDLPSPCQSHSFQTASTKSPRPPDCKPLLFRSLVVLYPFPRIFQYQVAKQTMAQGHQTHEGPVPPPSVMQGNRNIELLQVSY